MSDDLLGRAVEALRESSSEPNPRSGLTRARLLESAERRHLARGRRGLHIVFGVLGLFVAGSALARVAEYLPEVLTVFAPAPASAPAAPQAIAPRKPRPASAPPPESAPAPEIAVAPQPAPLPVPVEGAVEPPEAPSSAAPRPAPARAPRAAKAELAERAAPGAMDVPDSPVPRIESAELALFRRAQSLHLAREDGALAAWDAYLLVAGAGVLVPEARYNRALCLVRLGRKADARASLEAFARGDFGDYRRKEAQALLEALAR